MPFIAAFLLGLAMLLPTKGNAQMAAVPACTWRQHANMQPCLQAAINAAATSRGTVKIPCGHWLLSKPLLLRSEVSLTGAPGAVLLPTPGNRSNPVLLRGRGINHVTISGVIFDGGAGNFKNSSPLITITIANDVTVSGVTVQHARGMGMLLHGGIRNSLVENSRFIDIGNHWKITHRRADRLEGLVFCCGDNQNNAAINNRFQNIGLDALQMSNQRGFRIIGNHFDLQNQEGSLLPSPDYPAAMFVQHSTGGLIKDNIIDGAPGNGIDAPGLQTTTIEDNQISHCGQAGIGLFQGYDHKTQTKNIKILNNTLSDNEQWDKGPFKGGLTVGFGSPKNILVEGNRFTNTQATKTQKYGVMVVKGTQLHGLQMKGNVFKNNAAGETNFKPGSVLSSAP